MNRDFLSKNPASDPKSQGTNIHKRRPETLRGLLGNQTIYRLFRAARSAELSESISVAPQVVHDVIASGGSPLPPRTLEFFEPRFGFDFSKVRIHSGSEAAKSADAVNALAYTVGSSIVFADGQFRPESETGLKLLAHELTHVVQQRHALAAPLTVEGDRNGLAEREATLVAEQATFPIQAVLPTITEVSRPSLQRQPATTNSTERSTWNLLAVGWHAKDYLDVALIEHIERIKQEFVDLDEEQLRSLAQGAVLKLLARFVPGAGLALLMVDFAHLGIEAVRTFDAALLANSEEERIPIAKALAGILVSWAISTALGKLGRAASRKMGAKVNIHEPDGKPIDHSGPKKQVSGTLLGTKDSSNVHDIRTGRALSSEEIAAHEVHPKKHIYNMMARTGDAGARRRFRKNDVMEKLLKNDKHALSFLIDPSTKKWSSEFKFDAGHIAHKYSGSDQVAVEDRRINRSGGGKLSGRLKKGQPPMELAKDFIDVDGILVERLTLLKFIKNGKKELQKYLDR